MNQKLIIIDNERIYNDGKVIYCDNIEAKSIPEGLNKQFDVLLVGRKSKVKRNHKLESVKIKTASNIFSYLLNIFKTVAYKDVKYLLISISPYTFLSSLLLTIFRKKFYVYLRSDGYKEYKCILGFIGPLIFHIMFTVIAWKANLISCRSHILKGRNGKIVSPSQLSKKWFLSHSYPNLKQTKLLYVGRIKVEKGIFSLLKIIKNIKTDLTLSIVGVGKNKENKIEQKKVNIIDCENKNDSIIKLYDSHNIFILPSFTEGHPQVLDEALSRLRPVIIFEEISHVVGNRKGIFICKRNLISLINTINYIMKNYSLIQNEIKKNTLPTKENFIEEISNILRNS